MQGDTAMTKRNVTIVVDDENGMPDGEENKEEEKYEQLDGSQESRSTFKTSSNASTPPFLREGQTAAPAGQSYEQRRMQINVDLDDEQQREEAQESRRSTTRSLTRRLSTVFNQQSLASTRNRLATLLGSELGVAVGDSESDDDQADVPGPQLASASSRRQRLKAATATELQGLPQLDTPECGDLFRDLCYHNDVATNDLNVIHVIITYDSKHAVCLCINERINRGQIQQYSLLDYSREHQIELQGDHLVMNEIEQSDKGDVLCVPYQDNGHLMTVVFDNKGTKLSSLDLNELIGLDKQSKPIMGFFQPMVTACFVKDDDIYISVFHRKLIKQYNFIYSYKEQQIVKEVSTTDVNASTMLNFSIKSFYNTDLQEVYTFYRQGQCITSYLSGEKVVVEDNSSDDETQMQEAKQKAQMAAEEEGAELKEEGAAEEADAGDDGAHSMHQEIITTADLGQMFLVFDHALVVRSSNSILFFKKIDGKWVQYHKIDDMRGQIYFIRGNIRIQITAESKIFFYLINKQTFMPELENVMNNFIQCSTIMFGPRVRYGVAYKVNQPGIEIISRRRYHNFKVCINSNSFEGAVGQELKKTNTYAMADDLGIGIYESLSFREVQFWHVKPKISEQGKAVEILYMQISNDEEKIGVILGKRLIKDQVEITEIVIFARVETSIGGHRRFKLFKQLPFKFDAFTCPQFFFDNTDSEELLFFSATAVFKFNYMNDDNQEHVIYAISNYLREPPMFGVFNLDQTKCILTSFDDVLYIDLETGDERDIDATESISDILNVVADERYFYVLANKKHDLLGYYLLLVDIEDPEITPQKPAKYLINWSNKNCIKQVDLHFMHDVNDEGEMQKYVVVSYKAEGINTYNVFVFDVYTMLIRFWFECYQLYESSIRGFLLSTNDFMMLCKDGINVINLGSKSAREVTDTDGQKRMMKSLGSCNYLRIENTNHIHFKCQFYDNRRVCIQDQYIDEMEQTNFEDIYKIKVHEPTLRELLIVQSIFTCSTISEVSEIVADQPSPQIFCKVFLELNMKSLLSYLAFDRRSIETILNKGEGAHINPEYPLFFKNPDTRSAIDTALDLNQISSVKLMTDYIIKHQNSHIYSHLFKYNLIDQIQKQVACEDLFNSKILVQEINYLEWPSTSRDKAKKFAPYNKSMFKLRFEYRHIFKENYEQEEKLRIGEILRDQAKEVDRMEVGSNLSDLSWRKSQKSDDHDGWRRLNDSSAMWKEYESEEHLQYADIGDNSSLCSFDERERRRAAIAVEPEKKKSGAGDREKQMAKLTYQMNFLSSMSQEDGKLFDALGKSTELAIFGTDLIIALIDFRWERFAGRIHKVGFCFLLAYVCCLALYINVAYLAEEGAQANTQIESQINNDKHIWHLLSLAIVLIYPLGYDGAQLIKEGPKQYLNSPRNFIDAFHILGGYLNIVMQYYLEPKELACQALLCFLIGIMLYKLVTFFRVFSSFSVITTMIMTCIADLRVFMAFFMVVLIFFAACFNTLGSNPQPEYRKLNPFVRNVLHCLRVSTGESHFAQLHEQDAHETKVYWLLWFVVVLVGCLIFLNFIISEVSSSYAKVKANVVCLVNRERAVMVKEAEDFLPERWLEDPAWYPSYIVIRAAEE